MAVVSKICSGCGEWFDTEKDVKTCGGPNCKAVAGIISKQAKDHEEWVTKIYDPELGWSWRRSEEEYLRNHANWRRLHPPRGGAREAEGPFDPLAARDDAAIIRQIRDQFALQQGAVFGRAGLRIEAAPADQNPRFARLVIDEDIPPEEP